MKNMKTKVALALATVLAAGAAQAATTHTMTDGRFDFKDASGTVTADGHDDVQGAFDMANGTGSFTTSTNFVGYTWAADVVMMTMHNTMMGGTDVVAVEANSFVWDVQSWFIDAAAVTCIVTAGAGGDNCTDEAASGGLFLGTATNQIDYNLTAGQFAAHTLFDWSVNDDIPVLAIMQVTNDAAADGFMNVSSVDLSGNVTGGGNLYGVPMPDCAGCGPFPNQTPIFNGTIVPVPVPAAVWLFGSGLLGLVGVARRRKA